MKNSDFEETLLRELLNKTSQENGSDTPDFILARYLINCMKAYNKATNRRDKWYGYKQKISKILK